MAAKEVYLTSLKWIALKILHGISFFFQIENNKLDMAPIRWHKKLLLIKAFLF